MHFDAPGNGVVERDMAEAVEIEIGRQLAVDPAQQVEVELRGDALGVVVGGVQPLRILFQVDTDQHRAAAARELPRALQENQRFRRGQVADG